MSIHISQRIRRKLAEKHHVSEDEIRECFQNVEGSFLRDTREEHDTNPATHWFIAETNHRRLLKVIFIAEEVETADGKRVRIHIKSAFEPDATEIDIYARRGSC